MQEVMGRPEILKLLLDRANHVEELLVGSLLGFFLTASAGGFAGAYTLRSEAGRALGLSPRRFFHGISVIYAFLTGYYYFMLAQFYGATIAAIQVSRTLTDAAVPVRALWETLQLPSLGLLPRDIANIAMLINAPLFPLALSAALLYGFYLLIKGTTGTPPPLRTRDLAMALGLQGGLCILMAWHPFVEFLKAARLL
jgi:hypothetical protein